MAIRGHYDNDRYMWAIIIRRFYDNGHMKVQAYKKCEHMTKAHA
jgi:hypothetical protein